MMKKNLLTIVLAIAACLCLCFGLAACDLGGGDNGNNVAHMHVFTQYVSDGNATCTKDGTETSKCDHCEVRDTRTEAGSALGHQMQFHAGTATCTKAGTLDYWSCLRCEKDFADDKGSAEMTVYTSDVPLGHQFTAENKCVRYDACGTTWGYTEGFEYQLDAETDTYIVSGIGTASGDVVIPFGYQGKFVTTIGDRAFQDCINLTGIEIPESVILIGEFAFSGCRRLKNITIPANKIAIKSRAFSGCRGLKNIEIPESVIAIGDGVFADCSGLTSIDIPESVTIIGHSLFAGCSGLTSIEIPSGVTSIGQYAFYNCGGLENVTIGSGVAQIGNEAFHGCRGLESITVAAENSHYSSQDGILYNKEKTEAICVPLSIQGAVVVPEGMSSIEDFMFRERSGLTSIVLPDGVKSIGDNAFYGCAALESVTLPDSVTEFGVMVFGDCPIREATVPGSACWEICNAALRTVTITSGSIGRGAFSIYSSGLESVTIGENVTASGDNAFLGCTGLMAVNITDLAAWCRIDFEDSDANPLCFAHHLYLNEEEITDLEIPAGIAEVKEYAFYSNIGLTSVTIGDGVSSIGDYAFQYCYKLKNVTIGSDVSSIDSYAFYGCYNLMEVWNYSGLELQPRSSDYGDVAYYAKHVYTTDEEGKQIVTDDGYVFYEDGDENYLLGYTGSETELTLPATTPKGKTYEIVQYAFYAEGELTGITISAGVTGIGVNAFGRCSGIEHIAVVDNQRYRSEGDCLIDTNTSTLIFGCKNSVIPNDVAKIGQLAFENCIGLTRLEIPAGVAEIKNDAFSGCSGLESITVAAENPNFSSQDGILYDKAKTKFILIPHAIKDGVTIPDSVTSIGNYTFDNCTGLTSVTIGSGVTSIGESAFLDCIGLESITVAAGNPRYSSQDGILYDKEKTQFIFIPFAIKGEVTIPGGVTSIENWAFSNRSGIESIIILDGVTEIGGCAFQNCSGLTSITIPDSVTLIGGSAFQNCSGLTSITIPDSVTGIGSFAFSGCSGLTSITIPNSVTSIGYSAFRNCSGLESVTIPSSVTQIEDGAFNGCTVLVEIRFNGTVKTWQAIDIGSWWDEDTGECIVTCTDGTVDKQGNVTYFDA